MKKRSTKSKVYELIGRLTVYVAGWSLAICIGMQLFVYIVDNCMTTLK